MITLQIQYLGKILAILKDLITRIKYMKSHTGKRTVNLILKNSLAKKKKLVLRLLDHSAG